MVKIATFAKPQNVIPQRKPHKNKQKTYKPQAIKEIGLRSKRGC
jgi:hypothetical protein